MTRVIFDELLSDVGGAVRERGKGVSVSFPLEVAFEAARSLDTKRRDTLASLVKVKDLPRSAIDILLVIDVVVAAAAYDLGSSRELRVEENPSLVVDLWSRATAARALWYDLFIASPSDNSAKKLKALLETAILLGTEAVAQGLHSGMQPSQFTGFIAELARPHGGGAAINP